MADTGNGASITMSDGFTAAYTMIGGFEQEIPAIDTSHLGSTTKKTYRPGDLYEPGEFEAEFQYDPNNQPSIGTTLTITITYPVPSGSSNGATASGTGFIKKRKFAELKNNELMVGTYTVQWDGSTGPTFADAS